MLRRLTTVTAMLMLLAAAPAHAGVAFSKGRIEIVAPGARTLIIRNPFRLEIEQGNGRPALSEVPNGLPGPLLEPPTIDPVPPGTDNPSTKTLYAPLSFLVGSSTLTQYQGLVWGGNPMSGLRSGTLYAARRVLSAAPAGRGVRLVVSTSDPSGRRLLVTVAGGARFASRRS
jgi:hypothetical protein